MSNEPFYSEVERAISEKLCVVTGMNFLGPKYGYPVGIELGDVVMRDADCGLAKPTFKFTIEDWRKAAGENGEYLLRKVGFWSFERADDPAASYIESAHRHPQWAGRRLYELERDLAAYKAREAAQ